jgi:hypothetical protein
MKARNTLIGMLVVAIAVLIPATAGAQRDIRPGTAGATPQSSSVRPDDRAGLRGAGAAVSGASGSGYVIPAGSNQALVNDAGASGSAGSVVVVRPDDRAGIRGPGTSTPATVVQTSSDGFDWKDAFVGGLGGIGIALLLTGLLFFAASRRTRTRMA